MNFVKTFFTTAMIMLITSCSTNSFCMLLPVVFPDGKHGYGFRPEFNLTLCGLKITAAGTFATALAGLGVYFLKHSITSYIERNTTFGKDKQKIAAHIMTEKAKKYGIAAACCLAPSIFLIGKRLFSSLILTNSPSVI